MLRCFEFSCDNGESLRVTFALDCCDCEAMSWAATTGGHSGDVVRGVMLAAIESTLNKAFFPMLTSDDGRGLIDRNKHHDKNEGAKIPQLPEDHSQVVTGAAQHSMHRVTERPLQPVPIEFAICLHVADGWLDRTAPSYHRT